MAVLVTGGAGYIGSHMVWALLDSGEDVVVLDRLSTGFRWAVAPEARFYLGDVGDTEILSQIFSENDIDAVIHFAGSVVVPESIRQPLSYYENNTGKTRTLIAATLGAGIRNFIFSSTAAVYGANGIDRPIVESDPLSPQTPYGLSKLMSEMMLQDASTAHDLRYVALRYFNVAGADPELRTGQSTLNATHLIKAAVETALGKRRKMDVYGTDYPTHDGTGVRDFIHVADLAQAHLSALRYLRKGGQPLVANCGYGTGYSVLDVLSAVMEESGRRFEVNYLPRREGDMASVIADSTLLRRKLNWMPRHDGINEIVRTSLEWELLLSRRNSLSVSGLQQRLASLTF
ncbi:UDP-glucose 4-epimerase GalE [Gellertiella hungarica]|uniref:UDP-glucose 4-epimerase n=1 Tax=Gellertiella hungarica TaxID=1572859 RepID=A0A7W6J4X1_9HYPH|nr:UDP-glucose 4-epimerase GalE [Gellertiella hungarica]MBB4063933.1 UDP-glucose 4-epimerase [Gellertiella hungarica]